VGDSVERFLNEYFSFWTGNENGVGNSKVPTVEFLCARKVGNRLILFSPFEEAFEAFMCFAGDSLFSMREEVGAIFFENESQEDLCVKAWDWNTTLL